MVALGEADLPKLFEAEAWLKADLAEGLHCTASCKGLNAAPNEARLTAAPRYRLHHVGAYQVALM